MFIHTVPNISWYNKWKKHSFLPIFWHTPFGIRSETFELKFPLLLENSYLCAHACRDTVVILERNLPPQCSHSLPASLSFEWIFIGLKQPVQYSKYCVWGTNGFITTFQNISIWKAVGLRPWSPFRCGKQKNTAKKQNTRPNVQWNLEWTSHQSYFFDARRKLAQPYLNYSPTIHTDWVLLMSVDEGRLEAKLYIDSVLLFLVLFWTLHRLKRTPGNELFCYLL